MGNLDYICMRTRSLNPQGITLASLCDWSFNCVDNKIELKGNFDRDPKTVFIRNEPYLLSLFYKEYLPKVSKEGRFKLITGNTDATIPRQIDFRFSNYTQSGTQKIVEMIKGDERVVHWFAENCDLPSEKMTPIPTGMIDSTRNKFFAKSLVNVVSVEISKRPLLACCVHRHRKGPQWEKRKRVSRLSKTQWKRFVRCYEKIPSCSFLNTISQYPFVICVSGGGLDPSPKAWDAILAGCIPIIERSPVLEAYKELPVAVVDSWNPDQLSISRLRQWLEELKPHYEDKEKRAEVLKRLSMGYWWRKINEPQRH